MAVIPVVTSLAIEKFSGGSITIAASMGTNVVFGKRPSGNVFASQRPSINIFQDASATVSDDAGRGIYYWGAVNARYIVNNDTVYKADYSAPLAANISPGRERVEIFEVGDYLVILDAENNEGWTIAAGASTTLVAISDVAFPPNQTPALTLAKGGFELNSTLYAYCTNGELFNSDTEDPTAWNLLNFLTSEVRADGGVVAFKHSDHGALLGERSLEFVYDNANPTGSPLNFRQDVVHDIGTVDHNTFYGDANASYFVGMTASGDVGVYLLENFAVNKISTQDIDSFLTSAIITNSVQVVGSGFSAGGRAFYVLTLYTINGGITPDTSLVFDSSGVIGPWELAQTGINDFTLIDWTRSTGTRAGNGILSNGDILTVKDDFNPQDSIGGQVYVVEGYVDPGYITDTVSSESNIPIEIITGAGTFGTQNDKFMDKLRIKGTPIDDGSQVYLEPDYLEPDYFADDSLLIVKWSDESNNDYNVGRTINLAEPKNKLNRCGKFKSRNFKLSYSGDEQIEIEGLEAQITGSVSGRYG